MGIAAGPDGALWFTNSGNNSIGRISTAGVVSNYTGHEHLSGPQGITAGSDGALWFTNTGNNSIGRITTAGGGHRLRGKRHRISGLDPAGPDGALWFTNLAKQFAGTGSGSPGSGQQLHGAQYLPA